MTTVMRFLIEVPISSNRITKILNNNSSSRDDLRKVKMKRKVNLNITTKKKRVRRSLIPKF